MATKNISISKEWTIVTTSPDAHFLVSFDHLAVVEFCTTTDITATEFPNTGHVLSFREAITRTTLGSGYVWARAREGVVELAISEVAV